MEVPTVQVWPHKKPLFLAEKMLWLLDIFLRKNSSPFFSKLVRVRGPNNYTLLIGTIKPYNIWYWHFLLRSFLNKILDDPFHQTKKGETNKTVLDTKNKGVSMTNDHPYHNQLFNLYQLPAAMLAFLEVSQGKKKI